MCIGLHKIVWSLPQRMHGSASFAACRAFFRSPPSVWHRWRLLCRGAQIDFSVTRTISIRSIGFFVVQCYINTCVPEITKPIVKPNVCKTERKKKPIARSVSQDIQVSGWTPMKSARITALPSKDKLVQTGWSVQLKN